MNKTNKKEINTIVINFLLLHLFILLWLISQSERGMIYKNQISLNRISNQEPDRKVSQIRFILYSIDVIPNELVGLLVERDDEIVKMIDQVVTRERKLSLGCAVTDFD